MLINLLVSRPQPRRRERQALRLPGGLRLSLVSRRRARLSAQAHRVLSRLNIVSPSLGRRTVFAPRLATRCQPPVKGPHSPGPVVCCAQWVASHSRGLSVKWPRQLDSGNGKSPSQADGEGRDRKSPPSAAATWPPPRLWLFFLLILGANFFVTQLLAPRAETPITVPYTVFKKEVMNGNVESIYSQGASLEGRFLKAVTYPPPGTQDPAAPKAEPRTATNFKTALPAFVDPGLEKLLIDHKVEISAQPIQTGRSPWTTFWSVSVRRC